jgi:hypothetical protein
MSSRRDVSCLAGTRFLAIISRYSSLYTDYLVYVANVIVLSFSLTDGRSLSGSQHSRAVPEKTGS